MTLRLAGSTSGYTEIDAPAVAGSNTLVLPTGNGSSGQYLQTNGSGVLSWGSVTSSKILQVVQTAKTNVFSTTSSSFVDATGLSVSITPSSSSNKILVMLNGSAGMDSGSAGAIRLVRDATAIFVGDTTSGYTSVSGPSFYGGSNDGNNNEAFAICYLDSPGTTSAVTYKAQMAAIQGVGTLRLNALGSDNSGQSYSIRSASSITVMEVAA